MRTDRPVAMSSLVANFDWEKTPNRWISCGCGQAFKASEEERMRLSLFSAPVAPLPHSHPSLRIYSSTSGEGPGGPHQLRGAREVDQLGFGLCPARFRPSSPADGSPTGGGANALDVRKDQGSMRRADTRPHPCDWPSPPLLATCPTPGLAPSSCPGCCIPDRAAQGGV